MDFRKIMRVNLMQHAINTSISSSQISSDHHHVSNLLSNTNEGFMVEHFIKPPVLIEISFVCNMYLDEIIMNTRLGTQKSKGIEILINDSTIGKCFLNTNQDIVQWVRNVRTDKIKDCTKKDNISKCEFYSGAHKHLNSVQRVTIKIFKTENSSLVSIRSLKIFGSINKRTNTPNDIHKFVDLVHEIHSGVLDAISDSTAESISSKEYKVPNDDNSDGYIPASTVPDDFLDPITHEFMTNPLILPCGKIIDKVTLDKYLEIELKWNRLPNDPFTHVKFSQKQKPIQAIQLKSRIDKFLFLNRNDSSVNKLPRTLQNTFNKRVQENLLFKMLGKRDNTTSNRITIINKDKMENIPFKIDRKINSPELKRRKICTNSDLQMWNSNSESEKSNCKNHAREEATVNECKKMISSVSDSEQKFQSAIDLTEDVRKPVDTNLNANDLEKQIQDSLKNLPSFIIDSSKVVTCRQKFSLVQKSCFNCNQDHLLYKIIKCTHHVCRSCLVTCKLNICKFCNVSFSSNDVIRIFTS